MNLQDLEKRLQTLLEVHLVRALPGQKAEDLLIQRLTEAMRTGAVTDDRGQLVAPNVYTLLVQASSLRQWRNAELLETMLDILESEAAQAGVRFESLPTLTIAEDPTVAPGDFSLIASFRAQSLAETKDMQTDTPMETGEQGSDTVPENAFLIVEGVKTFQLTQDVVNIGRRLDNTLVVDDPRVSRNHAQLRAIKGRYVLFDLNSTGGTFVNGQRANQTVLYPGDVISLAGVSLIFGQENPVGRSDLSATSPKPEGSGSDRATAAFPHSMPPTPKKAK